MLEPDIVITLRREPFYHPTWRLNGFGKPQMGFEMTSFGLQAADEIERLRARVAKLENELRLEAAFQRDEVQREAL